VPEWKLGQIEVVDIPAEARVITVKFQLGCHEMAAGSLSTGATIGGDNFCFHPGYYGGAFRGPRSRLSDDKGDGDRNTSNCDMGWNPNQEVAHNWRITFSRDGRNAVLVKDSAKPLEYNYYWTDEQSKLFDSGKLSLELGGCTEIFAQNLVISFTK